MAAFAFDVNAKAGRSRDICNYADCNFLAFENGPLLDMQLDKCRVGIGSQAKTFQRPGEAGALPYYLERIAFGVAQFTLAGMAVGLIGTVLAGRALKSMLFGVSSFDPLTLSLALLTVAGASIAAVLLPARRAARVDPVIAIRAQ